MGSIVRRKFVFDTYKTYSIIGQTRKGREIDVRIPVRKEISIAKKFQVFSKNTDNKTELLKMLAINITEIPTNIVEIMATHFEKVLSNNLEVSYLQSNLTFACS